MIRDDRGDSEACIAQSRQDSRDQESVTKLPVRRRVAGAIDVAERPDVENSLDLVVVAVVVEAIHPAGV
jgi:hypothetical protein